ncbi:MAG: SBBP repeat-containing protein [Thermoplasmatota archaeon]
MGQGVKRCLLLFRIHAVAAGLLMFMAILSGLHAAEGEDRESLTIGSIQADDQPKGGSREICPDTYFVENLGQWEDEILFMTSTDFGHAAFTRDAVLYNIIRNQIPNDHVAGEVIRIGFEGSGEVDPQGIDPVEQVNNYFVGDESRWVSGARIYRSIKYENVWEDIDIIYRISGRGLKYDIILHPGSDPDDIVFDAGENIDLLPNRESISLTAGRGAALTDGGLEIAYGDGRHEKIGGMFRQLSGSSYGFELEDYDISRDVVIDPLVSSTYIGGAGGDGGSDVVLDSSNNPIMIGFTASSDFPISSGSYDIDFNGWNDIVVTKMKNDGSGILFSTYYGGTSADTPGDIAVDSSDNIFITGWTVSSDLPTTSGAYDREFGGSTDIFVACLSSDGSSLHYSTYAGGIGSDYGYGIMIDGGGKAYVGGYTYSPDFQTTSGSYQETLAGGSDCIIFRLSTSGDQIEASTFVGGGDNDAAASMEMDGNGDIFIAGTTSSIDFPVVAGAFQSSKKSEDDGFASKLDGDLSKLLYSTYVGSDHIDWLYGTGLDSDGCLYITGSTTSSSYPTTPSDRRSQIPCKLRSRMSMGHQLPR